MMDYLDVGVYLNYYQRFYLGVVNPSNAALFLGADESWRGVAKLLRTGVRICLGFSDETGSLDSSTGVG